MKVKERYRVFRNFPWYTVHAVIGTRVAGQALFKSLRRIPALRIAGALETAYRDGKYVEYMNKFKAVCAEFVPDADGKYQVDSCIYCGHSRREHSSAPQKGVEGEVGRCECGASYYDKKHIGLPCQIQYCRGIVKSSPQRGVEHE